MKMKWEKRQTDFNKTEQITQTLLLNKLSIDYATESDWCTRRPTRVFKLCTCMRRYLIIGWESRWELSWKFKNFPTSEQLQEHCLCSSRSQRVEESAQVWEKDRKAHSNNTFNRNSSTFIILSQPVYICGGDFLTTHTWLIERFLARQCTAATRCTCIWIANVGSR